jgi:hypothetical protein
MKKMLRKSILLVLAQAGLMLVFTARDEAQTAGPRALITQAIDENKLVTLAGNTRPEANSQNDLGLVANDLHLDMYLQLKRSPEQELAARQFVESLTDRTSPNYHQWITAAEYGQRFGVASEDIATVSRWLESHGFTVNNVPSHNMVIDFSGNAGQVREALHTEIHTLEVAGQRYFANMSDPRIPAALLPAVTGVVSLNNFKPHPMFVPKGQYTVGSAEFLVVPGDLATIYNLNPAFSAGYTGLGQTIVVVEDTDLYSGTGDWTTFRNAFGLSSSYPSGSLTQVHPAAGAGGSCTDPGINGDDSEAAIDVEWASAAAPNAAIVMASCANTTNFGGFIALQNLLTNGGSIPGVVSISYGQAEVEDGAAFNSYINTLYQLAAANGVSVFVSSGDSAAAGTDRGNSVAIHGINVSGWASTIYNVAVGGTDFGDTAAGTSSTYWNSTNGTYYNSAKSYVPEIPWNQSCGSTVLAQYYGFSTTYGPNGLCNVYNYWLDTTGGSGGPSACATGAPTAIDAVSGTCAGYAKPFWQSIFGNPADGVRDLPDVALFASAGFWGHYYVVCYSDPSYGGPSCTGAPSNWAGFGGTSVSSPIMAGIQALIDQALGSKYAGNPNPVYYEIGQNEYSTSAGRTACNSTTGPASTCIFNDITQGDMDVPCAGAFNCYLDGQALGVLSTSNTSYAPAYATASGWDFATGIGSVNASNLLNAVVKLQTTAPLAPTLVSPGNGAIAVPVSTTLTWNPSVAATSYDVYLGTSNPPPLVKNVTATSYTPAALTASTQYYWDVVAKNPSGSNASAIWSFTTLKSGAQPVSVNPNAGTAGRQVFTFVARDSAGASSIKYAQFLFSKSGVSALNACYISYSPTGNTFYLLSDDMTQWYGLVGGSANTIGNAQCEIHGATSGSSAAGTDLTVKVDLSFQSLFAGAKTTSELCGDTLGNASGWVSVGTWNDLGDPNLVEVTSLSPLPGTGLGQILTAKVTDGSGAATISFAEFVMNTTLNGIGACFIYYDPASNVFFLLNDAGTAWSGLVAGSATQVSNSQCTLNGVGSSGFPSGSTLAITYNLTFAAGFAGTKQIYMQAGDAAGNIEVWHNAGSDNP